MIGSMDPTPSRSLPRATLPLLLGALAWTTLVAHAGGSEAFKAAGLAAIAAILALVAGLPLARTLWPLAACALALTISSLAALEPWAALAGSHARALGFASVGAGLLLAAHAGGLSGAQRERLYAGLGLLGGLVAAYALAQRAGLDPWSWRGADPLRPAATLGNATTLAGWLLLALPPTCLLAWRSQRAWGALALLQFAALLASGTRSAWLGLAGMALCLYAARLGWRRTWPWALALAFAAAAMLAWRPASIADRTHLWRAAGAAWAQPAELPDLAGGVDPLRPWRQLVGYGPDQQRAALDPRLAGTQPARADAAGWEADRAHQALLDTLLQFGLLGLACAASLLLAIALALRRAIARREHAPEAWMLALALGAWALHQQFAFALNADQALALVLAGAALGLDPSAGTRSRRAALPVALLLAAVAASAFDAGRNSPGARLAPALAAERAFALGQSDYAAALADSASRPRLLRRAALHFERAVALRRYDRDAALAAASAWVEAAASERGGAAAQALASARHFMTAVARMTPAEPRLAALSARVEEVSRRDGSR